uniref:Uncharacterized protein n=1 Tax=Providencia stuartii (strain MRSN 2154) TaxID=1157951 RepID=A0A140SSF1_PROSM|nr:hypothetical protein pMR0211_0130 [Providencia stuartii]
MIVGGEEAQAIPVVELGIRVDLDEVFAYLADFADLYSQVFRGAEVADVRLALIDKVVRLAAVKALVRIRGEAVAAAAVGRGFKLGPTRHDGIQLLAVVSGNILDVAEVLESALYLEGTDPGVDQCFEVICLVVVLQRQHMVVAGNDVALAGLEITRHPALLRAFAAVGTAVCVGFTDIALAAVGHAQGAMDKELQSHLGLGGHGANLAQTQLPCQHHLRKAHMLEKGDFGRNPVIHLGTGVQCNRWQVQLKQPQVLHDNGIGTGLVHRPDQASGFFQFIVQ